jgi:hypothetical protein
MIQSYDTESPAPFSWDSPTFGQPGHNVHESASGSWLETER